MFFDLKGKHKNLKTYSKNENIIKKKINDVNIGKNHIEA